MHNGTVKSALVNRKEASSKSFPAFVTLAATNWKTTLQALAPVKSTRMWAHVGVDLNVDEDRSRDEAWRQLELVLGFFSRADAKGTAVLAIDIAMLGFLAANTPSAARWMWPMIFAIIPMVLLSVSIWAIYESSFPTLEGGHDSLIYFREIAKRTESQFLTQAVKRANTDAVTDILGQVWRNSEILRVKFDALRRAHTFLAWAIVPWLVAVLIFAVLNGNTGGLWH